MSKVAVVTDSTAYLPNELISKYNITSIPQILIWGDETFKDGVDIQPDDFYKRLETAKVMPSTSQITPKTMEVVLRKLLEDGKEVCGIFLSAKLSGTIQSATLALEMFPGEQEKIAIIDSGTTAMAMGFVVLEVAKASQAGASLAECKKLAETAREHTGVLFVVDTLEFLHRGGRIGGAQRFLGAALNFKPILELKDGRIESLEKVRTKSKAYNRVLEILFERIGTESDIHLATLHANAESDARGLLESASARLHPQETIFTSVSPVIGTHAGPGTVGLAYLAGMKP
jgi:DegV family protein with EDD domain